jgi:hypothetical protein
MSRFNVTISERTPEDERAAANACAPCLPCVPGPSNLNVHGRPSPQDPTRKVGSSISPLSGR